MAALLVVALGFRLPGIAWGLPELFEEAYPLKLAWRMWGLEEAPMSLNPGFFHYPSLMIYAHFLLVGLVRALLGWFGVARDAAAVRALIVDDPSSFVLASRALTATLGALTVIPVASIARRAAGLPGAALAGLLVAANPALVERSLRIEVDVPLTLATTAAIALAIDLAGRTEARLPGRAALCGLLVGLATSIKYPGILAGIPVGLAFLLRSRRQPAGARLMESLLAILAASAAFFLTSPFLLLDARTALRDLAEERAHLRLGHFGSEQGSTVLYYAQAWFRDLLGVLVGAAGIAGLVWFAVVRRERWAVVGGAFALVLAGLAAAGAMKADRYLLPLVPLGAIAAATLMLRIASRIAPRTLSGRAGVRVALVLGVLCVAFDAPRWTALVRRLGPDSRTLARQWIEDALPPGSLLISELYGPRPPSSLRLRPWRAIPQRGESRAPGPESDLYGLVLVPLFQVAPERSAVYYDPRLYASADAWIVTGAVRDRYRREPDRFPVQNAFYGWLGANWRELARFHPPTGTGPEIVIYRNPHHAEPFRERTAPPPEPTSLMLTTGAVNGEAAFYYSLGLNYYGFGRPEEAARCFRIALGLPTISGGVTREELVRALAAVSPSSP